MLDIAVVFAGLLSKGGAGEGDFESQHVPWKPPGMAKSARSGTGKEEVDAKMRPESQSERLRAPDLALTR